MQIKKLTYLYIFFQLTFANFLVAQNDLINSSSNYIIPISAKVNPANIGCMNYNWIASLGGIQASIFSNTAKLNMPYSPFKILTKNVPEEYTNSNGKPYRNYAWIDFGNKKELNFYGLLKIDGPSFYYRFKKISIGFFYEQVSYLNLSGAPVTLIKEQINNLDNGGKLNIINKNFLEQNLNFLVHQNNYRVFGFSFAKFFKLVHEQDLSVGVNYKFLQSLGGMNANIKTSAMEFDLNQQFEIHEPRIVVTEMQARNNKFKPYGTGAIDIGITWIYKNEITQRPGKYDQLHPQYKFKFSMALIDAGNLVYTRTIQNKMQLKSNIKINDISNILNKSLEEIQQLIAENIEAIQDNIWITEYGNKIKVHLPTRVNLFADYQINKRLFFSTQGTINLRSKKNENSIFLPGFVSAQLRFQCNFFEMGIPIIYNNYLKKISIGGQIRLANFYFSVSQFGGISNPAKLRQINLQMGLMVYDLKGRHINKNKINRLKRFSSDPF